MNRINYDGMILNRIKKSLDIILPIGAMVTLVGAIATLLVDGPLSFVFIDLIFCVVLITLTVFKNKITVKKKIFIIGLLTFLLGFFSMYNTGFSGTGLLILTISNLVVIGFVNKNIGVGYVVISVMAIIGISILYLLNLLPQGGHIESHFTNNGEWPVHVLVYTALNIVLLLVINAIKDYLVQSIDDSEKHVDKIFNLAYYDQLTGLPNKNMFIDSLNRLKPKEGYLLLFNIRSLNLINSIYGSDVGDHVIQHIGKILSDVKNPNEVVAKTGGNEFVMYCTFSSLEEMTMRIYKLAEIINEHDGIYDIPTKLNFNAGYAHIEPGYTNIAEILQKASMALEQAKNHKKHNVMRYDSQFEERFRNEEAIRNLLVNAIDNKEFYISYQEKQDCSEDRAVGVEALARWNSPILGNVPPNTFIPIVEKANLSVVFGNMIIAMVLDEYFTLIEKYETDITVAINISPIHLASPDFKEYVIDEVKKRKINPQNITLEITEDSLIENLDTVADVLFELREYGFKISLDDFGTGYSSLSYLSRLGFDELKIDRSFIQQLNEDMKTGTLIRTIINLKDTYGISIVAEGVETQMQSDILIDFGCNVHQGYLFSKPTPLVEPEQQFRPVSMGRRQASQTGD